jgi:hypothetical protein
VNAAGASVAGAAPDGGLARIGSGYDSVPLTTMPTSRPRISVTKDPALADALDRGRALLHSAAPEATLVHDLAVAGARLLGDEHVRRERSLALLADHDWLDRVLDCEALDQQADDVLPVPL